MNRLVNFSASVGNSGLNLILVLIIARTAPTPIFADFTAGVVYGGPFAVLLAFGNDTILARTFLVRPGFAGLVSSVRILTFICAILLVLLLHSIPAAAGVAFIAGTAIQQRFYFEAKNNQIVINSIGIAEKFASIAGVLYLSASTDSGFWWVIFTKLCSGGLVSAPIILGEKNSIGRDAMLDSYRLLVGTLPFLIGYVGTQSPALLLVDAESAEKVADFGTASQVGLGLLSALTLWQRPAVHRYINNEVSIRRELTFSVGLASAAILIVYLGVFAYGASFKLLSEWSVIHGFMLLGLATAVLHPFEVRGYANNRITGKGLVFAGFVVMLVAVPLARIYGFWAVPLAMIQYQLVIFLFHRLWTVKSHLK